MALNLATLATSAAALGSLLLSETLAASEAASIVAKSLYSVLTTGASALPADYAATVQAHAPLNATTAFEPTVAESHWLALFTHSQSPSIRLALILFVWHEIVFIGRYIPFVIADHIPYFRRYKIQADKIVTDAHWWKCVLHVVFFQLVVELPMMMAFHPVAMSLGMKFLEIPLPSWTSMGLATVFFLVMEDFYQYFAHRFLHWGVFYKHIHKMHHEYSAPFGLSSQYAHPAETLILGLGFFVGPIMWVYAFNDLHVVTMAVWLAVRLLQVVDAHSGYDFPWSLRRILPFWAGADFHDYHHMAFVGNYSSSFRWWDAIMGTDKAFHAWKAKVAAKKVQ
ncbi:hypothetical protein BC831DRAFT_481892 [Entophlyctis helioformis]|nr:hypothetical protein BC831DRAFT_481892 [Entophlyctis helioformis]